MKYVEMASIWSLVCHFIRNYMHIYKYVTEYDFIILPDQQR